MVALEWRRLPGSVLLPAERRPLADKPQQLMKELLANSLEEQRPRSLRPAGTPPLDLRSPPELEPTLNSLCLSDRADQGIGTNRQFDVPSF